MCPTPLSLTAEADLGPLRGNVEGRGGEGAAIDCKGTPFRPNSRGVLIEHVVQGRVPLRTLAWCVPWRRRARLFSPGCAPCPRQYHCQCTVPLQLAQPAVLLRRTANSACRSVWKMDGPHCIWQLLVEMSWLWLSSSSCRLTPTAQTPC